MTSKTDLNVIKVFLSIYEGGSVSEAGHRLHLTQPSISYALARLRKQMNDPLFTRTREGMVPTLVADQLYPIFFKSINEIEDALAFTKKFDPTKSNRTFKLALSDLGTVYFLPKIMRALKKEAPLIRLEVISSEVEEIESWFQRERIDAAVGNLGFLKKRLQSKKIMDENYACLISAHHPRIKEHLSFEQFAQEQHVEISQSTGHLHISHILNKIQSESKISLKVPHYAVLPNIIADSDLIACLPTRVAQLYAKQHDNLRVLALPIDIPTFEVGIFWKNQLEELSAQTWFCHTIYRTLINDLDYDS